MQNPFQGDLQKCSFIKIAMFAALLSAIELTLTLTKMIEKKFPFETQAFTQNNDLGPLIGFESVQQISRGEFFPT